MEHRLSEHEYYAWPAELPLQQPAASQYQHRYPQTSDVGRGPAPHELEPLHAPAEVTYAVHSRDTTGATDFHVSHNVDVQNPPLPATTSSSHASTFILGPTSAYVLASQSDPTPTPTQTGHALPQSQVNPYSFSNPPASNLQYLHQTHVENVRKSYQQNIRRRESSPQEPLDDYDYEPAALELELPPEHPAHLPAAADLRICTPPPTQPVLASSSARSRKRRRSASLDRQRLASMQGVIIPCTPPPEHTPRANHPGPITSFPPTHTAQREGVRGGSRAKMEGMLGKYRLDPFATRWCNQHVVYQPPVEFTFVGTREAERMGDATADTVSCGGEDDHEEDDASDAVGVGTTVEPHSLRAAAGHPRILSQERSPEPNPENPLLGGDTVSSCIAGQHPPSAPFRVALNQNKETTAGWEQRSQTAAGPAPTDGSPTSCHYAAIHQPTLEDSADADGWADTAINTANRPELGERPASFSVSNPALRRVNSAVSPTPIAVFKPTALYETSLMDRPPSVSSSMSSYDDSDAQMSDDHRPLTMARPPYYSSDAHLLPSSPPQNPPLQNTQLASSSMSSASATSTTQSSIPQYSPTGTLPPPSAPPTSHQHPQTSTLLAQSRLDQQHHSGDLQDPPKKKVKKVKMHPCSICGKEFPRPSGLQTHMNVHSGARPYECPVAGCPKRFGVRSNATRHLRVHQKAREHAELRAAAAATNGFSVDWLNSLPDHHLAHAHFRHISSLSDAHSHQMVPSHGLDHPQGHVDLRPVSSGSSVFSDNPQVHLHSQLSGMSMIGGNDYESVRDLGGMQLLGGPSLTVSLNDPIRTTPAEALAQQHQTQSPTSMSSTGRSFSGSSYVSSSSSYAPSSLSVTSSIPSAGSGIYHASHSSYGSGSASPSTQYPAAQVATVASTGARASGSYTPSSSATAHIPSMQSMHIPQRALSMTSAPQTAEPGHLHSHGGGSNHHPYWPPQSLKVMSNWNGLSSTQRAPRVEVGDMIPLTGTSADGEWPYHPSQWRNTLPGRAVQSWSLVRA